MPRSHSTLGGKLLALAGVLSVIGCLPTQTCTEDVQCVGPELFPGLCLYDGQTGRYCAIQTRACPSMWRWNVDADRSIRESCVPPELVPPDAGADANPPTDAGADGSDIRIQ